MSEPTESDPLDRRIEAALGRLGAEHEPPPGWEARVLAAVARPARSWTWWLRRFSAPVLALALALALFWWWPRAFALELTLADGTTVRGARVERSVGRGTEPCPDLEAHANQTLQARMTGKGAYHALWIYREERLQRRCPGDLGCEPEGTAFVFDLTGIYQVVAVSSPVAIASPRGSFDSDISTVEGDPKFAVRKCQVTVE
jgi:hypothetical protein